MDIMDPGIIWNYFIIWLISKDIRKGGKPSPPPVWNHLWMAMKSFGYDAIRLLAIEVFGCREIVVGFAGFGPGCVALGVSSRAVSVCPETELGGGQNLVFTTGCRLRLRIVRGHHGCC